MKAQLTHEICHLMDKHLSFEQMKLLENTLHQVFSDFNLPSSTDDISSDDYQQNTQLLNLFVAAKKIEGCSENTLMISAIIYQPTTVPVTPAK